MTKSYGTTDHNEPVIITKDSIILTDAERDLLQADRVGYGTRSKIESAFNLVNSTVGAGIIGLPFAIHLAGFWTGIMLSIIVSVISQLGLHMLVASGQRVNAFKYAVLMERTMGRAGYHFLNFLILVQATGACVSYYILLGDTIPVLLGFYFPQYPLLGDRSLIILLLSIFCVFPLNLSRSLGALAKWSIVSVLCLPVIILTLLLRAPTYSQQHESPLNWVGPDIFGALGILAFSFSCSHVCFSVFLSLKDQTSHSWSITTILATVMSWVVSMAFAVIGYLSFGNDLQPNLFLNFPADDLLVNIGRFTLGFSMILTIPMAFYPTREAVQKLLGFETATRQPNNIQHYTVTVALFVIITVLGIKIRSLGKVYALIGGFAATFLAYILPAIACLVTRRYPAVVGTITTTLPDNLSKDSDELNNKTHLLSKHHAPSTSSGSDIEDTLSEYETPIVIIDDNLPKFGLLDLSAIFLIIWGFVVMVFATSGVFK
ncbi:transmembrane amino acid transporter protein-domain-containing protein [Pilobolus umbonatus]|nr:transmembrane amino acid transporter protein-domain-containing protein [Pilobolus umbonatus]